jgi:hypothetical protein
MPNSTKGFNPTKLQTLALLAPVVGFVIISQVHQWESPDKIDKLTEKVTQLEIHMSAMDEWQKEHTKNVTPEPTRIVEKDN